MSWGADRDTGATHELRRLENVLAVFGDRDPAECDQPTRNVFVKREKGLDGKSVDADKTVLDCWVARRCSECRSRCGKYDDGGLVKKKREGRRRDYRGRRNGCNILHRSSDTGRRGGPTRSSSCENAPHSGALEGHGGVVDAFLIAVPGINGGPITRDPRLQNARYCRRRATAPGRRRGRRSHDSSQCPARKRGTAACDKGILPASCVSLPRVSMPASVFFFSSFFIDQLTRDGSTTTARPKKGARGPKRSLTKRTAKVARRPSSVANNSNRNVRKTWMAGRQRSQRDALSLLLAQLQLRRCPAAKCSLDWWQNDTMAGSRSLSHDMGGLGTRLLSLQAANYCHFRDCRRLRGARRPSYAGNMHVAAVALRPISRC